MLTIITVIRNSSSELDTYNNHKARSYISVRTTFFFHADERKIAKDSGTRTLPNHVPLIMCISFIANVGGLILGERAEP